MTGTMEFRSLGNDKISAIALGTTGSGTYESSTPQMAAGRIRLYHEAIDSGINIFDTAELYGGGYSEELLGKALRGRRDSVYISSKFNPCNSSYADIMTSVEKSLMRLHTDYIDLYQIHWPNPFVSVKETLSALEELIRQGKIRYFGVSNCSNHELTEIEAVLKEEKLAAVEVEYNLIEREIETDILPYCISHEIAVMAYSPLAQGKLLRRDKQQGLLEEMSKKYNCTIAQILFSWVVTNESVIAVVKTGSSEHLQQNIQSLQIKLCSCDRAQLERAFNKSVQMIPIDKIDVKSVDSRDYYDSIEEAIENRYDWIPSPLLLAERIKLGNSIKPIKLIEATDEHDHYEYMIDPYDLKGELKKFWAWKIVHGQESMIPAYIFN